MDPMVKVLKTEFGAPVEKGVLSVMSHFHEALDVREWPEQRFKSLIWELTGEDVTFADPRKEARTIAMYLVEYTMLESIGTDKVCTFEQVDLPDPETIPPLDPQALLAKATTKALAYIEENPWVFAVAEDDEPKLDAQGKPKRKKGAKQEEAARIYQEVEGGEKKVIIERFMAELDMSKAGATTYFYNMRKKFS